jgi:hypothetical protein
MHFIIFMELIGTVVLPAAFIFLLALIIAGITGSDIGLPLLFMCATLMLQAFLVLVTTRKTVYVMWMGVFLLAMPIWNLTLPLYAFWHFDDFSWGATRKVDGPDGHGSGDGSKTDEFKSDMIPMRRWHEWVAEDQNNNNHTSSYTIHESKDEHAIYSIPSKSSNLYNNNATPSSGDGSSYGQQPYYMDTNVKSQPPSAQPIMSMPEPAILISQPPLQGGYAQISAPYTPTPAAGSVVSEATASWLAYASEALKMPTPMIPGRGDDVVVSNTVTGIDANTNTMPNVASSAQQQFVTNQHELSSLSATATRPAYASPVMPITRTDIYGGSNNGSSSAVNLPNNYSSNVNGPRGPRERPETPRRR